MLVYNTLTKKKEEFNPIDAPNVTMYVCGPTVYDYFHIGNGRTFIMSDIIRRYLEYKGYNVTYAMNLTDVDDKIIKKANAEKITTKDVTDKYIQAFFDDITKLKVKKANIYPKATEHMGEIVEMIKKLEEKGFAYNVDGNVFFNVGKFEEYGKLSGKNIDELESGARIEINEEKDSPLDFALWKRAKENEPYWESPWGKGRPGWHIECSAMSTKHLGKTVDIHAGGSDLIFPHHENEIAQSECAHGSQFVNYWFHFGFLNIKNEKMSKSLGNFFTAREILKKHTAEAVRLFFSQSHYAGPVNFSDELLDTAQKGLEKINNLVVLLREKIEKGESGKEVEFDFAGYRKSFEEAMDDDFNTSKALAVIFDFVKSANKAIADNPDVGVEFHKECWKYLEETAEGVLGIVDFENGLNAVSDSKEDELIQLLLDIRSKAKADKNYAMADEIRNRLSEMGIELKDSKTGTTYSRN